LNVHLLVAHLITVLGMSYGQVINLLLSLYGMYISKAELSAILTTKHQTWLPAYEQLKADIRAAPIVHADETPWPIQNNDHLGYAWILSDATTPKVCYALENSRGAKHAKSLIGDSFMGVRLSDDYGAYRSLPGSQQLCWVHLYRCIRDLRYNDNLPEEHLSYVNWWYEEFVTIYQQLKTCLAEVHEQNKRQAWAAKLWSQVRVLCQAHPEPVKLTKLKAQLLRAGKDKLFVCLLKDTPCDNNRAERDLRQLVLKRKRSFGSQTEKGTKVLATILSVCTTTWRLQPDSYFKALTQLG
jgi:transposase